MLPAPGTEPVGAADADLTIVEYFDYNWPYCKKMAPVFERLLTEDHHLRIIYKDWPILGGIQSTLRKRRSPPNGSTSTALLTTFRGGDRVRGAINRRCAKLWRSSPDGRATRPEAP
jgi:DSBA-like thioredoxin domain